MVPQAHTLSPAQMVQDTSLIAQRTLLVGRRIRGRQMEHRWYTMMILLTGIRLDSG